MPDLALRCDDVITSSLGSPGWLLLVLVCTMGVLLPPPLQRLEVHDFEVPRAIHPLRGTTEPEALEPGTPLAIAVYPQSRDRLIAARAFVVRGGQATPLSAAPAERDGGLVWQAPAGELLPGGAGAVQLVVLVGRPGLLPAQPGDALALLTRRYERSLRLLPTPL